MNKTTKKKKDEPQGVLLRHELLACMRCSKEFEHEKLTNIAFPIPYHYVICGRCNDMSRATRRLILNQIIQKVQDDNCDT